jgi:methionyl-tRNA formyltransferase
VSDAETTASAPAGRRTVYLGTSEFAASVLRRLAASPHRPALVVTRPDRPKGRGRTLQSPPVADLARELGLDLDQPEDVNGPDAVARIAAAEPDVLVVCAYGALVKEALLDAHEILNVHPSLLPRWRGAAPIERAIMAGDAETGVAIMRLTAGLDSGPVCLVEREPIRVDDTYGTLAPRLEDLGSRLLLRALDDTPPFTEQPEDGVTYAEKIGPADRTLDPAVPAADRERVVRALHPHVGARIALDDGSFLGVHRARVTPDGDLELLEVQPAGGRPMPYADYLRGRG